MKLDKRVVETSNKHIRGYVRQSGIHEFRWTIKNWDVPEDEPPVIVASGVEQTPLEAFVMLYHKIAQHNFKVVKE